MVKIEIEMLSKIGKINLNTAQKRYLHATLLSFEKSLRLADRLLSEGDEIGILYYRRMQLNASQRLMAREKIARALQELAEFVHHLGLEPVKDDPTRIIMAYMSMSWADLEDGHANRLHNYGELPPETAAVIDPVIDRLAGIAIELSHLIPDDQTEVRPEGDREE